MPGFGCLAIRSLVRLSQPQFQRLIRNFICNRIAIKAKIKYGRNYNLSVLASRKAMEFCQHLFVLMLR